ncbi:hypothetical protein CU048_08395 [Beijerinckiaceae bacterium]|nr:hypothetical protein CU048_08395 [Beijerinckiaceae bacterium]
MSGAPAGAIYSEGIALSRGRDGRRRADGRWELKRVRIAHFEDLDGKPLGEAVGALRNVTGSRWARKLTATAKKENGLDRCLRCKGPRIFV